MFTGDKVAGMVGAIAKVFPDAAHQRCTVRSYRNVLPKVPKFKRARVTPKTLRTRASQAPTGGESAPTTPQRGSIARAAGARD